MAQPTPTLPGLRGVALIGNVLDKYEILQKIGEGGMATVYRGRHLTLGRDVAIKVLHPHLSRSERNRQRFAREARAIEHLDHDNILKIFDYSGTTADECYIVTEFVDGVTLQALLAEHGRIPSEVATLIGIELAHALAYAHHLGIIHRDLKPENVMMRRDGAVKLMDFGIARFLDEVNLTVTGALVGSPAYMSPEQAMERVLDPRSDLFSLGTLLFHLVTGQLPFPGNNPSIILRNIIEGNRPEVMDLAPDISGSLADLVERLLQSAPADRPADAPSVVAALGACLAEVQIDPADPNWNLQAWLMDPRAYQARLEQHLCALLIDRGRARLDSGDHLGALRLFNRLLSLDEDNEEVLTLVQGMHHAEKVRPGRSRRWWVAGVAAATGAAAFTWLLWPEAPAPGAPESPDEPVLAVAEPIGLDERPTSETAVEPTATPPASVEKTVPPLVAVSEPKANRPVFPNRGSPPPISPAEMTARVAAVPDPPGRVTVVVPGTWARIFIDNVEKGRTGEDVRIPVTPGKHVLRVENDFALPHTRSFEVAAGEELVLEIDDLQPKPVTARFHSSLRGDCDVTLDGTARGSIDALGGVLVVNAPETAHHIVVSCAGEAPRPFDLQAPLVAGAVIVLGGP